jgi:HEAT repeat protein
MSWPNRFFSALLIVLPAAPHLTAQPSAPIQRLLAQFDSEHDLARKEALLRSLVSQGPGTETALLQLAETTTNEDTRWMSMRGMAEMHCSTCAPFLVASLRSPDAVVRANAARSLGELRIQSAAAPLLTMFAAEQDRGAIEQASLALWLLGIKEGVPYIREKLPAYSGQTRAWLIQALGKLGTIADVPLIAGYLDDQFMTDRMAAEAIESLAGVNFGPRTHQGLIPAPPPEVLVARAWWKSHQDRWPACDDCHPKSP